MLEIRRISNCRWWHKKKNWILFGIFLFLDLVRISKGSLYKLDKNLKLTKVDKNYKITNGPAFIDKYNLYHTDSRKKTIYKIKINKKNKNRPADPFTYAPKSKKTSPSSTARKGRTKSKGTIKKKTR